MKKSLSKLLALNVAIGITLLIIFYFSAFILGYGSNINHLPQEKALFITFVIFHLIIAFFILYRYKQFNSIGIAVSIITIAVIYLIAAWRFEYFK